jgi:hypothetical protein
VLVQKYGGSSVANLERIRQVADRVARTRDTGRGVVVVVVSAMGETSDELLAGRGWAVQGIATSRFRVSLLLEERALEEAARLLRPVKARTRPHPPKGSR